METLNKVMQVAIIPSKALALLKAMSPLSMDIISASTVECFI